MSTSATAATSDPADPPPADLSSEPSASNPSAAAGAVIDLTSTNDTEDAEDPRATVTPPSRKRTRASRRLEDLELKKNDLKPIGDDTPTYQPSGRPSGRNSCTSNESNESGTPQASDAAEEDPSRYYLVDEVLDRRTRKYGSETAGLRHVVEYLVSWKVNISLLSYLLALPSSISSNV